jgi:regulatory protein
MVAGNRAKSRSGEPRKPPPPLDQAMLDAFAVRYVERFQTTRARLVRQLKTKLRLRGWQEGVPPPDPEAVADRMVQLGYIDDAAFAEARTRGLTRRGMGAGRVRATLSAYGVGEADAAPALEAIDAARAALDFARRKRLGPFGAPVADPRARERQMAMMARAGHPPRLARDILRADTVEAAEALAEDHSSP